MSAHRVLGVAHGATRRQVKDAFRLLAKEWHPDLHQGAAKARAEERFKAIQQAYQALLRDGTGAHAHAHGTGAHGHHRQSASAAEPGQRRRQAGSAHWGPQYGAAGRPGYDPFRSQGYSYSRTYDSAAQEATHRVETNRTRRWLGCLAAFGLGLGLVMLTSGRNRRARESGESVDAYYNQATRRWEPATAAMMRDPLLSTMVHLKPKTMVHQPARASAQAPRVRHRTLDGRTPDEAFRARQAGTRHGP